ncbi:MAG: OmpA family protein [Balneolaceae bacterium]|nr:OmpA family protein [Balneolaceae bacterium]
MLNSLKSFSILLVVSALMISGCGPSEPAPEPDPLTIEYLRSLSDEELRNRDSDGDEVSDYDELYVYETDPLSPDTDEDGLNDYDEIFEYGTDPLVADSDDDGLSDGDEVNVYNTDPLNADSDEDGLTDGEEVNTHETDPLSADTDNDGLSDGDEVNTHDTNPLNPDSDGDGFSDGQEVENNTNPLNPDDPPFIREGELNTINFGFDRSNITDRAAQLLSENVERLMEAEGFGVRVDAYTDHVGGDQYNLRLSVRRANSVADFYKNNGIGTDRIELRGLGKAPVPCSEAEMDENTPGCEKNRRAESHPLNPFSFSPMYE